MAAKLFGNNIAPSCEYCSRNQTPDAAPHCTVGASCGSGKCAQFSYDPLLRKPKVLPPMQQFHKEDFSL